MIFNWSLLSLQLLSIHLPVAALAGSFPAEIGQLSSLHSLLLPVNNLSSPVPLELSNCPSLTDLDLGRNSLSGSLPVSIWNSCGNQLASLRLHWNRLSGAVPTPPVANATCPDLKVLDLDGNTLGGGFPVFVTQFSGLQKLDIGSNRLMAEVVVMASVLIGWYRGRKRRNAGKRIDEDEMEIEEGDGIGEGRLMVFQGGEHLTLEEVLNATGQVMEKTSYGTMYKAKLADGGMIALPLVRHLGRARHENLVPLRAFYQGNRGEKLLIYDYLHNRSLHDLLYAAN